MLLEILVFLICIWGIFFEGAIFYTINDLSLKIKNCEEEIENIKNELNKKQENYSRNLKIEKKIPPIKDVLSVNVIDKRNGNVVMSFDEAEITDTKT